MPTAHRGLPERAGPTGPTLPGPAVTLAATTAIQVMAALAALSVPAIAPAIAAATAQPASMVGTYISLVYLGSAAAALASGPLVPAAGALRLSQLSLVLCALALLVVARATLPALAISALVLGLGYGPITPASSHMLARSAHPDRIALTFSVKQTGVPAGVALAGILVPALTVWLGWKAALGAVAVLCLACAAAVQPLRAVLDHDRDPGARFTGSALLSGVRLVGASGPLRSMAALSFVYSGLQNCTSSFIVAYLVEELGYGWIAAGIGLTAANLAGVAGRIAWGVVSDRWLAARRTLQALGVLMAIACALAAALTPRWPALAVYATCALLGATAIGWNGVFLSEVARRAPPGQAGAATGGSLFVTFVGSVVWPPAFGLLQRASGSYGVCFAAAGALCAAAVILAGIGWRSGGAAL
ncbi:MAG: MFS transporter [Betaproteobacteria bacterium]|nr:MAG: MFS transporter [Betaproteobacteria bacterium]